MRWVLDSVLVALLLAALLGGWVLMRRTARRAQAQRQAAEAAAERRQRRLEVLAQVTFALRRADAGRRRLSKPFTPQALLRAVAQVSA